MRWTSILAIYILFWTMSLFLVLPFGVRTGEEVGASPARATPRARRTAFSFDARRAARRPSRAILSACFTPITSSAGSTVETLDWAS